MKVNVLSGWPEFVEESLNEWLSENPNFILWNVFQSQSTVNLRVYLTITVWYREAKDESTSLEG
jgi:hypothetical protein